MVGYREEKINNEITEKDIKMHNLLSNACKNIPAKLSQVKPVSKEWKDKTYVERYVPAKKVEEKENV